MTTIGGGKVWNKVLHWKRALFNYAHLALFCLTMAGRKGSNVKVYLELALLGLSQIREGDKAMDEREQSPVFYVPDWMLALLCDDNSPFSQFDLGHAQVFTAFRPFHVFKKIGGGGEKQG